MITFSDFQKLDLRIGTIIEAEPIEGADKLLKLTVNTGEDPDAAAGAGRTLVAGIAQHYTPEDLVGRQIVVVTNLEPRELRGVESQGMLLAASDGEKIILLQPDAEATPGSKVS